MLKPAKKGVDLPDWVVHRMVVNNAVSAGIGKCLRGFRALRTLTDADARTGFVPLVGDIALAIWRANSRNVSLAMRCHASPQLTHLRPQAKLLEEFLRVKGEEHILAGLPGLTTEQPLPPGARSKDGGTAPEQHPAQASAKEFVKSNSSNNLQPGGAQAAARK